MLQLSIESLELGSVPPKKVSAQAFADALKSKNPKLIVPANAVTAYNGAGKWQGIFTVEAKQ